MFFALAPEKAHLSDSNSDLISCFKFIHSHPDLVHRYLKKHLENTSEDYYYLVRGIYNHSRPSAAQAARFIYLNKSSFNGIFRVNQKGEYNVPYGNKEPPAIPSLEELRTASGLLNSASLTDKSFDVALSDELIQAGDFIYMDPPYPPLNGTSYFRHYTASRFSLSDHERVADVARRFKQKGCYVMVSNADLVFVRELFSGWYLYTLPVVRWIAANGTRFKVAELVITNYSVEKTL